MKSTKTMHSMTARPAPVLEDEISRFPGQCPLRRWSFPIDFQWKVLECVQLCIGKIMWNVIFIFITLMLSCFMDPNESNHGHPISFVRDFSRSLPGHLFQHLADQQFLPASQRVFRARSPEMALVRSTFKDWQKIRFGCLVFLTHSNHQEKFKHFNSFHHLHQTTPICLALSTTFTTYSKNSYKTKSLSPPTRPPANGPTEALWTAPSAGGCLWVSLSMFELRSANL